MANGYLQQHEIKRVKPIKSTFNPMGYEAQRSVILMRTNGQPLGSYLCNSVVANSGGDNNQRAIERAIAEEMRVLESMGLPHSYVDACRSLLVDSDLYELTEAGLLVPSSGRRSEKDESILDG